MCMPILFAFISKKTSPRVFSMENARASILTGRVPLLEISLYEPDVTTSWLRHPSSQRAL